MAAVAAARVSLGEVERLATQCQQNLVQSGQQLQRHKALLDGLQKTNEKQRQEFGQIGLPKKIKAPGMSIRNVSFLLSFSYLGLNDLGKCACVSRTWSHLIKRASLQEKVLINSYRLSNPVKYAMLISSPAVIQRMEIREKRRESSLRAIEVLKKRDESLKNFLIIEGLIFSVIAPHALGLRSPADVEHPFEFEPVDF